MNEVGGIDSEVWHELSPQCIIDLPSVLRCVCEASYVERLSRVTHLRNIPSEDPTELSLSEGPQASELVSTYPDDTKARILENDHFCQPVFRAYHKAT